MEIFKTKQDIFCYLGGEVNFDAVCTFTWLNARDLMDDAGNRTKFIKIIAPVEVSFFLRSNWRVAYKSLFNSFLYAFQPSSSEGAFKTKPIFFVVFAKEFFLLNFFFGLAFWTVGKDVDNFHLLRLKTVPNDINKNMLLDP